jgi:adenosylhomocysteine nucleosidase
LSATGVVAAFDFEARCLGRLEDGSLISVSGVGAENAARAARALVAAGAGALLSFGVAGALDPQLTCGTAVLPLEVLRPRNGLGTATPQRFATDGRWRECLRSALPPRPGVVSGALLSSAAPVATATLKQRLFRDSGAVAVDMESAAVAAVAADHGLPFLALRVILDTARDSLPASLMRTFEPAAARRSLWPLLLAPSEWCSLLRLAAQYRIARRAMSRCAQLGQPTRRSGGAPAGG